MSSAHWEVKVGYVVMVVYVFKSQAKMANVVHASEVRLVMQ